MKILVVDVYGAIHSTGKITSLQYRYLKQYGHDVKVCYRGIREPKIDNPDFIPIAGMLEPGIGRLAAWISGYEGYTHPFATRRLINFTKKFHPDVVQLNILHGYYINSNQYISYLRDNEIPTCYSMLDEYPYMGKCAFPFSCAQFRKGCKGHCPEKKHYPRSWFFDRSQFIFEKKKKAYEGFKEIVFTGPRWVVNRAKSSALLKNFRIEELDEPVDFGKTFFPRDTAVLRGKLGIPPNNKVIVTVAQMSDPRKGGIYVFQVAERLLHRKDISFVFVGCNESPIQLENMTTIPYVSSQDELAHYYSLGDLFICTSLADTMPNVCIDAMGCGTPVAGFAEAGTPYVATSEFGTFTPTYNIDALAKVIEDYPLKNKERINACHEYAVSRYAPEVVIRKLESIYKTLLYSKDDNKVINNTRKSV